MTTTTDYTYSGTTFMITHVLEEMTLPQHIQLMLIKEPPLNTITIKFIIKPFISSCLMYTIYSMLLHT